MTGNMDGKIRVMFLCTGNACRSQMAEGLMREIGGERFELYSAGIRPIGVHPNAVRSMAEIDIDITGQTSDLIDPALLGSMDYAVTLCGNANEACPTTPPGVTRVHWPIDDPSLATGTDEDIMKEFSRVRDDIRTRIEKFIAELG
jgi:arsenate reductase